MAKSVRRGGVGDQREQEVPPTHLALGVHCRTASQEHFHDLQVALIRSCVQCCPVLLPGGADVCERGARSLLEEGEINEGGGAREHVCARSAVCVREIAEHVKGRTHDAPLWWRSRPLGA